jgi:AraC-like DNA-binding protein
MMTKSDHRVPPIADIRSAILSLLADGYPTASQVARRIGYSKRTLQRRLAASGTSYSEMADEVRYGLAARLLADPQGRVSRIAKETGFANASAFSRAFQRWAGMSPRAYRQQFIARKRSANRDCS